MKRRNRLLLAGLFVVSLLAINVLSDPVFVPGIGQKAWFTTVKSALAADLLEANATSFLSETGIIQIAIKVTSGSATAGTITVYTQVLSTDTVYIAIPTATYSLITSTSRVSDKITVGPGYHKLVVSGAVGTFNFNLLVRDF